jgi:endonuclease/exonuclease/phosphatase family metal-dependent hydrolase
MERLEGMLVSIASLRVVAPTQRLVLDETNATSTSNGVFYGVVDGVARPFREPGIPVLSALPSGTPCCVPRFDENPERLRVDSDGQPGGVAIEVAAGALLANLTGPLDFSFRTWTLLPDPASPPVVSGTAAATPVPTPSENEFTIASFNLERFFDDVNDPGIGEPVLTPTAFSNRLAKASLAIRDVLRSPDVVGVQEAENLNALTALADRLNADAIAAGQPDPAYAAYLEEGNDVGGIDSGFLVKGARVSVVEVTQVGKTATYVNPNNGATELLNDRPPLVLRATVQGPLGPPYAFTVIANHLRSLNGIDDETPDGSGTAGDRVRAKRRAQAEYLANLIQSRQAADPQERLVSLGDYNAFTVSDGYVDSVGTVKGQPTPANEVVLASPDLVSPDLVDLAAALSPDQGYSYSFDGNTQTLDHILVNAPLQLRLSRFHHARANADFPESLRNDPTRPERLSDHDMPVAFFAFPEAPTLTLLGPNPLSVECCTTFVDPGATAHDDDLGDLTSQIVVSGSVDARTVGAYTLTYSVSNGFLTTTVTRTVNVVDTTPPALTLRGASSLVLEKGALFVDPGATASDTCAGDLTSRIVVTGAVNSCTLGRQRLTYTVSDGYNASQTRRIVRVVDTRPPTITAASVTPSVLWPANHQLVPVAVTVQVGDACAGSVRCRIVSITSDEPVNGWGDGHTAPDWVITGDLTAKLRAERSLLGNGRVYTLRIQCRDLSGNASATTVRVTVPLRPPR